MKKMFFALLTIVLCIAPAAVQGWEGLPWDAYAESSLLRDRDGDTRIECEHAIDEDKIRLYTAGVERVVVDESGNIALTEPGELNPISEGYIVLPNGWGIYAKGYSTDGCFPLIRTDKNRIRIGRTAGWYHTGTYIEGGSGDIILGTEDANVGIGTDTFGTNAQTVLGLGLGQAPESNPADMVQVWAGDYAAGDCSLYIMGEAGEKYSFGADVRLFEGTSGNPSFYIYGYDSDESAVKSVEIRVNSAGNAIIEADETLYLTSNDFSNYLGISPSYFTVPKEVRVLDNVRLRFGSSQDADFTWDTGQTNDALLLGLSGSNSFIICELTDMSNDFGLANQTDPTLFLATADTNKTVGINANHSAISNPGTLSYQVPILINGTTYYLYAYTSGS